MGFPLFAGEDLGPPPPWRLPPEKKWGWAMPRQGYSNRRRSHSAKRALAVFRTSPLSSTVLSSLMAMSKNTQAVTNMKQRYWPSESANPIGPSPLLEHAADER